MGLRLNKILGWGLDDLEPNDERIDWDKLRNRYEVDFIEYYAYLLELYDFEGQKDLRDQDITLNMEIREISEAFNREKKFKNLKEKELIRWGDFRQPHLPDIYKTVSYNDEGGLKNVIVFTPLREIRSWQRYADPIDYAVHDLTIENTNYYTEPYVDRLSTAPWPYDATWVDKRTQEPVQQERIRIWRWITEESEDEEAREGVSQKALEMSYDEALQYVRPKVPEEIIRMTNFLQIFKDPKTILSTEPMIYTCFS